MKHVVATDENGAQPTAEQLAETGIAPGEQAIIEIRRYSEDEWLAEAEGRTLTSEEFLAHVQRAPGHASRGWRRMRNWRGSCAGSIGGPRRRPINRSRRRVRRRLG
jgi:hypothetical protein